jgi:DNA-directed RNA polymerase specialized sigma24 family protein
MKREPLAAAMAAETGADLPDGEVMARSQAEPELFALVFRRHAVGLGRYVARRLGPGPAEDIVAETFLAAFRHRDRYDMTRTDARPWLYGIAGNLIRRQHRDEARQLRALPRSAAPIPPSVVADKEHPHG